MLQGRRCAGGGSHALRLAQSRLFMAATETSAAAVKERREQSTSFHAYQPLCEATERQAATVSFQKKRTGILPQRCNTGLRVFGAGGWRRGRGGVHKNTVYNTVEDAVINQRWERVDVRGGQMGKSHLSVESGGSRVESLRGDTPPLRLHEITD